MFDNSKISLSNQRTFVDIPKISPYLVSFGGAIVIIDNVGRRSTTIRVEKSGFRFRFRCYVASQRIGQLAGEEKTGEGNRQKCPDSPTQPAGE